MKHAHVHHPRVLCGIVAIPSIPLRLEGYEFDMLHLLVRGDVLAAPLSTLRPGPLHAVLGFVGHGTAAAATVHSIGTSVFAMCGVGKWCDVCVLTVIPGEGVYGRFELVLRLRP